MNTTLLQVELTEEQKAAIGVKIATIFCLKQSKQHPDRFLTAWGNKTALGLFYMFERIQYDITCNTLEV